MRSTRGPCVYKVNSVVVLDRCHHRLAFPGEDEVVLTIYIVQISLRGGG
jgi:hypothetical protein